MDRARGFMELDPFRGLIDEISSHANHILMNFAGEPLLNPRIGEMVEHTVQHGLGLTLGTHGNIDKMDELVEAGLPEILFAIDGLTQDVYQKYRVGGDLEVAIANLEKLMAARRRAGTGKPKVILQFVVMKHNEDQISDLIELGKRLAVDEISLQPVCVNDFFEKPRQELVKEWVPEDSPFVLRPMSENMTRSTSSPLCIWPLQSVVLYNGDVTMCCFDADGRYVAGNAFEPGGFRRVWNSREYRELRKKMVIQELELCRSCDISTVKPTRFFPVPDGEPME